MKDEMIPVTDGSVGAASRAAVDGGGNTAVLATPTRLAGHYSCTNGARVPPRAQRGPEVSAAVPPGSRATAFAEVPERGAPSGSAGFRSRSAGRPPPGAGAG